MEATKPTAEEDAAKRKKMLLQMRDEIPELKVQAEYEELKTRIAEARMRSLKARVEMIMFNANMQKSAEAGKEGGDEK